MFRVIILKSSPNPATNKTRPSRFNSGMPKCSYVRKPIILNNHIDRSNNKITAVIYKECFGEIQYPVLNS